VGQSAFTMASTEPWDEAVGSVHNAGAAASVLSVTAEALPPEDDEGAVEYKWSLVSPSKERLVQLVTQLKFRLAEGGGEAIYEVGVEDDGQPKGLPPRDLARSLDTLQAMAAELDAEISVLREADGKQGRVAQVLVRKLPSSLEEYPDVRIAVCGQVDSGKSSLVGVLTGNGALDNGRGLARAQVFSHRHEIDSGRTSAVSQQIMGFGTDGRVTNYTGVRNMSWTDIVERSTKLISLFDLAGHEKYLKTTVFGLAGHAIDYCLLVVNANMGSILRMCKEHLQIALALKLPIFVVVTKIDLAPPNIYEQTVTHLQKLLRSPGARKLPVIVKNSEDVLLAQNIVNDRVVPIFPVSNVTGEGLDLLRSFLNLVPSRRNWSEVRDKPAEFAIDEIFQVSGVGTVVAGTTTSGSVELGQVLHLGPDGHGKFVKAQVKSVHYKRTPVKRVVAGQAGSLALKKIKRNTVRKGMVLLDSSVHPGASWEFTAEVLVLYHGTTIRQNYQPVVHLGTVRQAARVLAIDVPIIRTGDRAIIRFRWLYAPEYVKAGSRFIFREGRTKGLGKIISVESFAGPLGSSS
jgi:GTPase